jgi:hypothetical protein
MHTFQVGDSPINEWFAKRRPTMKPWLDNKQVRAKVAGDVTLHGCGTQTVGGTSPLFHALGYAFNNHCPLVLTPDSIWLTILTGLTHHIDSDPEGLRGHFVDFDGKETLEYKTGGYSIDTVPPEVWEDAVRVFTEQLQGFVGKKADLIVCDFSTTTDTDRISSQIALMGAMKNWFEYKMMLCCDLTQVTIEGTPDDWGNIIDRANVLTEFGLDWWTDHLIPCLNQLRLASEGTPEIDFWKDAYLKHRKGSGGDYDVSGWINAFYPYVAGDRSVPKGQMRRNPFVDWQAEHLDRYGKPAGLDSEDFPIGLVTAPVLVNDHGVPYDVEFHGGLVGVSMQEDFTVRPESGFAMQLLGEAEG